MPIAQQIYLLKGKVQHYSWGGYEFIPHLLSVSNDEKKPFAEYWLGAHPSHPSTVKGETKEIPLTDFIKQHPEALGDSKGQFHTLPFLMKILDVRQMLSIQVHPDKASAAEGFQKENESGTPLTAPNRNYKDDNHKPEMMVALSDFWLLHGFKPADKLIETLTAIPYFQFLADEFKTSGYKTLYEKLMLMDQQRVNEILKPLINKILPLYKNGELVKSQESFWAARAAESFCSEVFYDRGIFSIYLFNLVHLKKGEGIYQGAGLPHAYLEGQNVELMANSDNVLRAGLTDKYIDVAELLKHVRFEQTIPQILGTSANADASIKFDTPAREFELYQYSLNKGSLEINSQSPEIILLTNGGAKLFTNKEIVCLNKGDAAFITAHSAYTLSGSGTVFRATVPSSP